ncbi:NAD(P)-dependent oxidoreductase [Isosphaeraceae bacterium EP7]
MSPDDARDDDDRAEPATPGPDEPSRPAPPDDAPAPEVVPAPDDALPPPIVDEVLIVSLEELDEDDEDADEPTLETFLTPAGSSPLHGLAIVELDENDEPYDDDEPDPDDEGDDDEEPRTVLITGASGTIGRALRAAWGDYYDLVLIDREPDPDEPNLIVADLSTWDDDWVARFDGVDTVVHLAANPDDTASWASLVRPNLDCLNNVMLACALGGVERVVFASSAEVLGGYRDQGDMPITADLPPRPITAQGASKLIGERLGKAFSTGFDLSFVALRLGHIRPGGNHPEGLPDAWSRSIWISNDDLVHLFESAVEADLGDQTFLVVHGISNNRGTRWDHSGAEEIGYVPEDDSDGAGADVEAEAEADIDLH